MDFDFQKDLLLENTRVKLQPLNDEVRGHLLEVAENNPLLLQFSPSTIDSKSDFENYFNNAIESREARQRYAFSIYDKLNSRYAGSTSFGHVSNKDRRIEIGWTWIGAEFQRTGLNRNCKYLLMEFVFEQLEFERLELKTDARNMQSRDAIERIGGKFEGTLRSHTLMSDGHRRDTVYYSILKEEWSKLKGSLIK